MSSNFNITFQFLYLNIETQAWVKYSVLGLIRILYFWETIFSSLEINLSNNHHQVQLAAQSSLSLSQSVPIIDQSW